MNDRPSSRPAPKITADSLRDVGLFVGLDEDSLHVLARELPTDYIEVGRTVVEEGDDAREMFIVITGELEVVKRSRAGSEARVAMLGPGDWFGEMSILDVQPRSASVRAIAPTIVLRMAPEHVEQLLHQRNIHAYARLILNIARELSRRLRVADGILAQFVTSVADEYVRRTR